MMRIVIVEDNPITLNVLTLSLQAVPSYQVMSFLTAQEGITACAEGADLAIFDNQLPDMTGTAAVAYLRSQSATRHLPVIVITGDGDRKTRIAAISAGATDFLEKPVQIDELRIRVRNLLALSAAEKEARAGQALLETLIAGADARVAVADAQHDGTPILYASDPVQRRVSDGQIGLQGTHLCSLWSRAAASAERDALERAVAACASGKFVLSDPLGDGDGWVEITLSPVAEASGIVRYLVVSMRTVTDLIETRQAHAQLSSRLRDIAQLSDAWFFELDDGLLLSYVSSAMAQTLDGDPEALIGLPVSMLPMSAPDLDGKDNSAGALFAAPHHPVQQAMVTLRLSDGRTRALQINASPFQDDQGQFAGYRGHASDVSEIIRARDLAAQASRAKSVFLATMSHEMRTPLTAIIGLAELAATEARPDSMQAHLVDIGAQAMRLSLLLSDVLDAAAIDKGHPELNVSPFDLTTVADASIKPARQEAEKKGLEFEFQLLSPRSTIRTGDAVRVGSILRALISNAIKFTLAGKVTVKLDLWDPDMIVLCVEDTGIGMTEAERASAVLPFVQGDDGIARQFEGAGLGLSIVTWLTDAMGGHFDLTSTPGQGTRVRVSLPLPEVSEQLSTESWADRRAATYSYESVNPQQLRARRSFEPDGPLVRQQPSGAQREMWLGGYHVLVADDNLANRKILKVMLGRLGAEVTLCSDGAEAVEAWQCACFDIVLLDINMPLMAGTEVIQAIRRQETAEGRDPVPALAVTANTRPDDVAGYLLAGFDGCVAKPFTSAQLADQLSKHIPVGGMDEKGAPQKKSLSRFSAS